MGEGESMIGNCFKTLSNQGCSEKREWYMALGGVIIAWSGRSVSNDEIQSRAVAQKSKTISRGGWGSASSPWRIVLGLLTIWLAGRTTVSPPKAEYRDL